MPDPGSPGPSWKQQAGLPSSPDASKSKFVTQAKPGGDVFAWWKRKTAKISLALGAGLVVLATLIWVVLWPTPDPRPHLILIGAGYEHNLAVPHNAHGWAGLLAVKDWAEAVARDEVYLATANPEQLGSDPTPITELFERSWWPGGKKIPSKVVVFVSTLGLSKGNEPFLVPQEYDPGNPKQLFPFYTLLSALEKLPRDTKKILLLDVAGARAHPAGGLFGPTFHQAFKSDGCKLRMSKVNNLAVILSAGEDQFSWAAPEWGTTAFAHYVVEGLKGDADRKGGAGTNHIDALELFEYVKKNVQDWATRNREREQEPQLIDESKVAEKTSLVYAKSYTRKPLPTLEERQAELETWERDCVEMWHGCQTLAKAIPPPWATAPHLWRQYLDTLLRVEELFLAGDKANAETLLKKSEQQVKQLEQSRSTPMYSRGLTFAMPDVAGLKLLPNSQKVLDNLTKLMKENDFQTCVKQAGGLEPTVTDGKDQQFLVRTRAAEQLLRLAAESPKAAWQAWDKGFGDTLAALDDPVEPRRSAEAHFLMMLHKAAPLQSLLKDKQGCWGRLKRVLEVRLLAEKAAVGLTAERGDDRLPAVSEQVHPWIKEEIERADQERRKGEDLLFTSSPESWREADKALDDATDLYKACQEEARRVRLALLQRDRAMAHLPYYGRWLAVDSLLLPGMEQTLIVKPWQRVHELHRLVQKPQAAAELDKLRGDVASALDGAEKRYRERFKPQAAHTQGEWHEIDALLRVPAISPKLTPQERMKLLSDSRRISWTLQENMNKGDAGRAVANLTKEKEEARRHFEFTRASLGDQDEKKDEKDELGARMANLAAKANVTVEPKKEKSLAKATASLGPAAALARQVEGWAVEKHLKGNPVQEYGQLLRHQMLCALADRAYHDHWAAHGKTPDGRHYYQMAGGVFLQDAKNSYQESEALSAMREKLEWRTLLAVEWSATKDQTAFRREKSDPMHLGDEPNFERNYRLVGPADDVRGSPVAWVVHGAGLGVEKGEKDQRARAFGKDASFPSKVTPVAEIGTRGPENKKSEVAVKAYFRGHEAATTTPVTIYGEPDLIVVKPERVGHAKVAVQSTPSVLARYAKENVAISLVLDCSGSMTSKATNTNITRWKAAKNALRDVLKELPRGVSVSLRAYSAQEMIKGDLQNDPEMWTKNELIWKSHPWDPDDIDRKWKAIDPNLTPHGHTPLMRSMWMAREDFPAAFKGRRIMVVVTDGGDSNFYAGKHDTRFKDLDLDIKSGNSKMTIAAFLQDSFAKNPTFKNIEVHVIGFDIRPNPLETVAERDAAKELPSALLAIKGKYHVAKNTEALVRDLKDALFTVPFRVGPAEGDGGHDEKAPTGTIGGVDDSTYRWVDLTDRTDARHTVHIPGLPGPIRTQLGERLVLELKEMEGRRSRLGLVRRLYAKSAALERNHNTRYSQYALATDRWHLASLQKQMAKGSERLRLMATLEKEQGVAEKGQDIQVVRPTWTWFEVSGPRSKGRPANLRVTPLAGYPAPAWGMDVPVWQADEPVTLDAWWLEKTTLSGFEGTEWFGPRPGLVQPGLRQELWPGPPGRGRILIESVGLERYPVALPQPDSDKLQPAPRDNCLVVRLSYPPGTGPFFVQPGQEEWLRPQAHSWFAEAGKYTGVFWPVYPQDADSLRYLQLLDVAKLKKEARGKSHHVTLQLGLPAEQSLRPPSIP